MNSEVLETLPAQAEYQGDETHAIDHAAAHTFCFYGASANALPLPLPAHRVSFWLGNSELRARGVSPSGLPVIRQKNT
jgi:hypothetical protein